MKERPILFSAPMVRAILSGAKTQTRRVITPEWARCLDLGDRLWVRETWGESASSNGDVCIVYRADGSARHVLAMENGEGDRVRVEQTACAASWVPKWRPSIHMPRWASRLTLEVVSVRVERLQDISEADAKAEGVVPLQMDHGSYKSAFEGLWDSINAKRAPWNSNPWVFVVEFRRVES